MITYKGNPLVKGKHFIYENQSITYSGKIYGDKHLFISQDNSEIILTESEATNLKSLLEHSLLSEQDNSDDLYQVISSYTDKQLDIINNVASNKKWETLKNSFQEELNKLNELGLAYKVTHTKIEDLNEQYFTEMIMDFLQDIQHNISDTSLPNIYTQLNNYIYNIQRILRGDK